jgi:hypothetical protein
MEDPYLAVPSPTYLLENVYCLDEEEGEEEQRSGASGQHPSSSSTTPPSSSNRGCTPSIHHFDLYRLASERELARLDLARSMSRGVCLFEWAERLGGVRPPEFLAVHISILAELPPELREGQQQTATEAMAGVSGPKTNDADWRYDGEEDDDDNPFTDKRCRRVMLVPHGDTWQRRLSSLSDALTGEAAARAGLLVGSVM